MSSPARVFSSVLFVSRVFMPTFHLGFLPDWGLMES